ncbi:MAG: hypothetical protein ABJ263_03655 [Tateyamaria sp.]|uniref:hypothetical protein n=1 Tax=Tateyamaria sp. TaxID=1929288 RepID=UPI00326B26C7
MKPNFALSLSFDGIRLLQRAAGGWYLLGEVSVSNPDLAGSLATLRIAGEATDSGPLYTKLIIPDEQVRYLSIQTPGQDDAARKDASHSALDGATPYLVDALAFDISPDGDTTHIAAVARETLQEAEDFARQHGFAPVSFAAAGTGADFLGEPFFGPTAHAKTALPPGTEVEPDGVRVVIVEKPAEPDEPVTVPVVEEPANETAQPDQMEEEAESLEATADAPELEADAEAPEQIEETPTSIADAKIPKAEQGDVFVTGTQVIDADAIAEDIDITQDAPLETEQTTPPLLGFATRRRQDPSSNAPPLRLGGVSRATETPSKSTPSPSLKSETPDPGEVNLTAPPKSAADSLRPTEPPLVAAIEKNPAPLVAPVKERPNGFLSRRKAPVALDADAHRATARVPIPAQNLEQDPEAIETERMTVFGARSDGTVRGKPRFLGLILTALLIVFLAGVAAWASVFLDDGLARLFPPRERTLASTLPDDTSAALAEDVGATTDLEPDPEAEADGVVVAALNDSLSEDGLSSEDAAVLDALRDPLPEPVAPEELDAAALEARYAVTGIWPKAPDVPSPVGLVNLEDLYVTGIDPVSPALDAVALPRSASFYTDRRPALITSPAAPGTNFARDAQGRIVPTVEGALSPDGFTVFLGRPPIVPPVTRARLEVDEEANPNTTTTAQIRPRARPNDLIEQNERATLGGLSRSELAALRPRLRPQAPQEIEQQNQEETAEDAPISELATATSLRPASRPRNFARTVARATPAPAPATTTTTTTAATESAPKPQRTASVAPRTVTPKIPSSASVTREATMRNAINLRRVNLIGVYGTPSNRRALVRLANGRYQKVEVGDRFDGGRVSAIGDSELRYQKSGRNVVLKMPKG